MQHKIGIEAIENACVAFGHFDTVHKGHQATIEALVQEAKATGMKAVIVSVVDNSQESILSTEEEKIYHMEGMGIDEFITYECDSEPDIAEFTKTVIIDTLGAKTIVTGKDENYEIVAGVAEENKVKVIGCELALYHGIVITTYDVRQAFMVCNFEKITWLCGHAYTMIGVVEHGKALGRTVGMPTANLGVCDKKMRPASGVYATLSHIEGETFKGLTNIGKRPSVDDDNRITIETHLLDFAKDIYGKIIVVEVQLYIRGVVKFNGLAEVQKQVAKDLSKTRTFLDQIS